MPRVKIIGKPDAGNPHVRIDRGPQETEPARHRAERADGERRVAAEQDRQAAEPELGMHRVVHGPVPGGHFLQMPVAVDGRQPRVGGAGKVAAVDDLESVPLQHAEDVGDAQRLRPHAGAARAGADVGRCADQADERIGGDRLLQRVGGP